MNHLTVFIRSGSRLFGNPDISRKIDELYEDMTSLGH
jgi:hypothetical protein